MRGMTHCVCGTCLIPLERVRRLNKERFEVLTIPFSLPSKKKEHTEGIVVLVQNGKSYTTKPNWLREKAKTKKFSSIQDRSLDQESYRESKMAIGWTEQTMDALAAEGHSCVTTPPQRKRYDNTWRINLNSQGSNTAPRQRADCKDVTGHLREAKKKRKPFLLDTFSIPTFPSSTEFDSVRSNNSNNLKDRAQIMEPQGDLALGLSIMVLSTQSGGAGGKIAGMYCTVQSFQFFCF